MPADQKRTKRRSASSIQGCEPIRDQLRRVDLFYELGLRILQITHHNDNPWGGGAIEAKWTGLTRVGVKASSGCMR